MNTFGTRLLLLVVCSTAALSCPTNYEELHNPCMESYNSGLGLNHQPSSTENRLPTWCRFFAHMHACYVRTTADCSDTDYFQQNRERLERWTNHYVLGPEFCATNK